MWSGRDQDMRGHASLFSKIVNQQPEKIIISLTSIENNPLFIFNFTDHLNS